jgi:hypothetical protein
MITIKQTSDPWAKSFGLLWEVQNDYSEFVNFFTTWDEAINYLSTLNY